MGRLSKNKTVLIILRNEIIESAVRTTLKNLGYDIQNDFEACEKADFGMVCSYFVGIGVANQLRAIRPDFRMVLIVNPEFEKNGKSKEQNDFYDNIKITNHNETEIKKIFDQWLLDGKGKDLIQQ